jgi:small basic protein
MLKTVLLIAVFTILSPVIGFIRFTFLGRKISRKDVIVFTISGFIISIILAIVIK